MESRIWPERQEKPREAPVEKVKHRLEWAVGWCPECQSIQFRPNRSEVLKHLRELRDGLVRVLSADAEFECRTCGFPLGKKEDVEKMDSCPWCGGSEARRREK